MADHSDVIEDRYAAALLDDEYWLYWLTPEARTRLAFLAYQLVLSLRLRPNMERVYVLLDMVDDTVQEARRQRREHMAGQELAKRTAEADDDGTPKKLAPTDPTE